MKMKNEILYNMVLPLWLLILVPRIWALIVPLNFIVDSIVFLLIMCVLGLEEKKILYKKSIIKIWIMGFAADIIAAIIMIIGTYLIFNNCAPKITKALVNNPFDNLVALFWTFLCVLIGGAIIYAFDKHIALKQTQLSEEKKRKISLLMAVFTAPYVMLIPTELFINYLWI